MINKQETMCVCSQLEYNPAVNIHRKYMGKQVSCRLAGHYRDTVDAERSSECDEETTPLSAQSCTSS